MWDSEFSFPLNVSKCIVYVLWLGGLCFVYLRVDMSYYKDGSRERDRLDLIHSSGSILSYFIKIERRECDTENTLTHFNRPYPNPVIRFPRRPEV